MVMPAGGGLSVLDRLRMSTITSAIPIIVLTSSRDPEVEKRALGARVARFLRKPFDSSTLLDSIKTALGAAP